MASVLSVVAGSWVVKGLLFGLVFASFAAIAAALIGFVVAVIERTRLWPDMALAVVVLLATTLGWALLPIP